MEKNLLSKSEIIEKTCKYVKNVMQGDSSGHDYWHVYRVWKNAQNLLKFYKEADALTVECAALLHDIADWKFNGGDSEIGASTARDFLKTLDIDEKTCTNVFEIIKNLSFKGANVENKINTLEGMIVQDADRLDAIGAIGIARTFAYGGAHNREIYNPDKKPEMHDSAEAYLKSNGGTINHFYEKLLLLKDRMNTSEAKNIAQRRHEVMLDFLNNFYGEWEGLQ